MNTDIDPALRQEVVALLALAYLRYAEVRLYVEMDASAAASTPQPRPSGGSRVRKVSHLRSRGPRLLSRAVGDSRP
jgi:hypothetical protein